MPDNDETRTTRVTTDHDEIRRWAEEHGAAPAAARGTGSSGDPGVLTFDVVGYGAGEEDLEHVEWDEWFAKFEDKGLALAYQGRKRGGEESTFFRLIERGSDV